MKNTLGPVSAGEILQEEFLVPMHITAYRLAKEVHIPQSRISEIINGKRRITADTAMRFSVFFGTTPEFWLNIQNQYDLDELKISGKIVPINEIRPLSLMQG
ncbi:MAG: HigA family addiction module antitoxin [Lachnospiraceae bacterium]|nr:HigA family addiction module antitoxin [Lachnospiraceae bacterium]